MSFPSIRTWGGEFVVTWRSVPPCSTSVFKSWWSVTFIESTPTRARGRNARAEPSEYRFPENLLHRGMSVADLVQTAAPERDHRLLDGPAPQLDRRGTREDHLADRVGDLHHLVEPDAALVTRVVARHAALSLVELHARRVVLREADVHQGAGRHVDLLLAALAEPPHEALGADQVHGRRDEERLDAHVHEPVDRRGCV